LAKLMAQCLTASLLFFVLDIRLESFYGLFSSKIFPIAFSYPLTLIAVVIITNALNLIDGIDGLAAAFSFVACIFFGTWFYLIANFPYAILCLSLAGGILAFLFQNWEPSNIFMGDTGSLVIGTILSVIMIQFINENFRLGADQPFKFNSSVGTAICVMIIPLADTTRIILIRLAKGISPFVADKRHIHHALIRIGFSHRRAVYTLTLVHVSILGMAILLRNSNQLVLLSTVLITTTALCLWLDRLISVSPRDDSSVSEVKHHPE
jgi:UDP-GlcNAc:undecaprenyl-phosphate GlcNAc-1-phosphate transferase